jgi:hypothetical protein
MKYLMLLLISGVVLGKCPNMRYKYSVGHDGGTHFFNTNSQARSYIMELKKGEDEWTKLIVTKFHPTPTHTFYQTKWETTLEHGYFCVCPPCRKKFL